MKSQVYYVVKSILHYYPPCVAQIRMLNDLGISITAVFGSCDPHTVHMLEQAGIECVALCDPRGVLPGKLDKMHNWLSFRFAFKRFLKTIRQEHPVIWVGNAETLLAIKGLLPRDKLVLTFLELYDQMPFKRWLMKRIARQALAVVTCEETRAYLMQSWFGLSKLPYTMPNKPYGVDTPEKAVCTSERGKYIMDKVQGRKFVLYQGIFQNADYYEVVAKVLRDHYPDYCFVMMGMDKYHRAERILAANPDTIIVDYIPSPLHLEVTSNATIGLLFYLPESLNKAFCAPNKIFEYSKFGLPILANKLPGLQNTIGKAGAGICTDFTYESIKEAIGKLIANYETYSRNSRAFYESVDNVATMRELMTDIGLLKTDSGKTHRANLPQTTTIG